MITRRSQAGTGHGWKPLFLGLVVGLIFLWPNLLMPILQHSSSCHYSPLVTTTYELEETVYASGIREVFDGHLLVSDAQLFDNKRQPSFIPRFPYLVLGLFAKILGSLPRLFMVCDFLFPALIFFLAYFLLYTLTKNPTVSTMGGVVLLLGSHLVPYIPLQPQRLFSEIINYHSGLHPFNRFSRLPYDQFSFTILILSALLIYVALIARRKLLVLPAGVVSALTFYTYFYHYTFITAACSVTFITFLIQRRKQACLRMGIILFTMAVCSIPFWISYLDFKALPQYPDILMRMGIEFKSLTILRLFVFAQVAGYFLISWLIVKKKDHRFWFLASFLAAGPLCYCIPIVIGFGIQSFHWSITALDPFIIIFISFVYGSLHEYNYTSPMPSKISSLFIRSQKGICTILILFFVLYGLYTHTRYSITMHNQFCFPDALRDAFHWLNDHTSKDAVVASSSIHSINLIPAYTHCNNYAPNALMTVASSDEIVDRMCIAYRIFQVPEHYLEKVLTADDMLLNLIRSAPDTRSIDPYDIEVAYWSGNYFHAKFAFGPWNKDQPYQFPKEIKDQISRYFTLYVPLDIRQHIRSVYTTYQAVDISYLLKKYRVDYLLYGPFEKAISTMDVSHYDFVTCVYDADNIQIYKVQH